MAVWYILIYANAEGKSGPNILVPRKRIFGTVNFNKAVCGRSLLFVVFIFMTGNFVAYLNFFSSFAVIIIRQAAFLCFSRCC